MNEVGENLVLIEDFLRYGVRSGRQAVVEAPSSPSVLSPEASLASLDERVRRCTACDLARTRAHTVFGEGVTKPRVLVIGEGPGAEEDRQGRPFVGASGNLLDKMLAAIGLSRATNCYIGNIVKCRPPNNREPAQEERDACIPYLLAQIEILKPEFILCVGRTAAHSLLGTTEPISRLRGRTLEFHGIPVRITFHPSALLRDESLKRPAWEDLKQFLVLLRSDQGNSIQNQREGE